MNEPPVFQAEKQDFCLLQKIEKPISYDYYMSLYRAVGDAFNWTDRLKMDKSELVEIINKEETHIFKLIVENREVGYSELFITENYVEIQYFGLFTPEIGKGYGSVFFDLILKKAWSFNKNKVQLNTCDLDHPKALKMYFCKGFEKTRQETIIRNITE